MRLQSSVACYTETDFIFWKWCCRVCCVSWHLGSLWFLQWGHQSALLSECRSVTGQFTVVLKAFSAMQLLITAHTIKPSQAVGRGCKTLSASSRGMQQHWAFPPHLCLKIPSTSPADRNILGKPHSEQDVCMIKLQGWSWAQADLLWLGWAQRFSRWEGVSVPQEQGSDPPGTAGWMLLLSLNRIQLALCQS